MLGPNAPASEKTLALLRATINGTDPVSVVTAQLPGALGPTIAAGSVSITPAMDRSSLLLHNASANFDPALTSPQPARADPNGRLTIRVFGSDSANAIGSLANNSRRNASGLSNSFLVTSSNFRHSAGVWYQDPIATLVHQAGSSPASATIVRALPDVFVSYFFGTVGGADVFVQLHDTATTPSGQGKLTRRLKAGVTYDNLPISFMLGTGMAVSFTTDRAGGTLAAAGAVTDYGFIFG